MDVKRILEELNEIKRAKGTFEVRKIAKSRGYKDEWINKHFPEPRFAVADAYIEWK